MSYYLPQKPGTGGSINLVSAGNDSVYTVSSADYFAPNVTDYKYIADVYVNGILQTTLKSFPDPIYGYGVFNLKNIAPNFLGFDFLFQEDNFDGYIFHNCPNSSANIQLQFGEEYTVGSSSGSTFVQNKNIVESANALYINSALSFDDYIYWNTNNDFFHFVAEYFLQNNQYNTSAQGFPENQKAFTNQRKFLYYVNGIDTREEHSTVTGLQVTTTDINGDTVGVYQIAIQTGINTAVQMVEVGYPQLITSDYTVISGAATMFGNGNETGYNIFTLNSDNAQLSETIYYDILTDCGKYANDAVIVHWLNSYGGFDSWLFNKKNETTQTKEVSTYKKTYGTLNSDGTYSINNWERSTRQYYTKLQDSISINTDFLTDTDVLYLEGLFNSPVVLLESANGFTLIGVTIKANSYKINKVVNKKIYSLSLTVEPAMQDFRQPQ